MVALASETRSAIRVLGRRPILLLGRAGLLALGIGTTLAAWSMAYVLTTNPVGASDPQELVSLGRNSSSYANFADLAPRVSRSVRLAAWANVKVSIASHEGARSIRASLVSGDYFDVFRPALMTGRSLSASDVERANAVVIISSRLAAALAPTEGVIGAILQINGADFTIAGVVGPHFAGPTLEYVPDIWIPLSDYSAVRPDLGMRDLLHVRRARWVGVSGRLAPGVPLRAAANEVHAAVESLKRQFPDDSRNWAPPVNPLVDDAIPADVRSSVLAVGRVLVGTGFLALTAGVATNCVLLLMAGEGRTGELAIRRCLGAGATQLLWAIVVDNAIAGALAVGGGIVLALWYTDLLRGLHVSPSIAIDAPLHVSMMTAGLILGSAFLVPIVIASIPLGASTRMSPVRILQAAAGRSTSARAGFAVRTLIVVEIALATVAVTVALMLFTLSRNLQSANLNFDPRNLIVVPLEFGSASSRTAVRPSEIQSLAGAVESIPGVTAATWATVPPFAQVNLLQDLAPSLGGAAVAVSGNDVDSGYFHALNMPFVAGSPFRPGEEDAIILNQTAARMLVKGDPIGAIVSMPSPLGDTKWRVVGVVADSRYFALDETPRPFAYFPLGTDPISTGVLLVRSTVGPNTIVPSIREEVAKIRPTTPVGEITTMAQMVDMHLGRGRFLAFNAAVFSILAISAAAGGLFGSISQLIRRRRREIGTRLALGATALESTWPLLRQAIILTSAGLVCGVALGWIAKTLLIDHIYRLSIGALEPIVAGAVLLLIVLAGSIAPPLTRACRLSPSILLRVE